MEPITWTVTEATGEVKRVSGKKLAHRPLFEVNEKTKKEQLGFIEGWNEMRKCLIENGLMEEK